ncbi:MAG: zinc ribbon domain-containing protein [Gemmatimonadales bacterium]|nr:zinc ribbon domain-containing protein [Gemmatimonadales bacterium]
MTDLERFVAALLVQWRADGGAGGGPIDVGTLLDRTMPYRTARRLLGIDISEDYEALVLRLIAGEEGLATTHPEEAGEMARATMADRIPDLDTLRLLRSAELTLTDDAQARLADASFGEARAEANEKWRAMGSTPSTNPAAEPTVPDADADADAGDPKPFSDVIPLPVARDATRVAPPTATPGPPPAYLTGPAAFVPPEAACWSCTEELPTERAVKFCPFCGASQQPPACGACGTAVERAWKHCPECGIRVNKDA